MMLLVLFVLLVINVMDLHKNVMKTRFNTTYHIMHGRVLILVFFLFCFNSISGQDYLSFMAYNCENLFDIEHDYGKKDYDFLPDGDYHWTRGRMYSKLKGIAKVIVAVDQERPVDLVGLCEVENDSVVTFLTERTVLHRLGYKYLMTNSNDERGIDVALLYSPYTFHPIASSECIRTYNIDKPTRDILHVCGTINSGDTVDVYVCHLPSMIGGKDALTSSMKVAKVFRSNIDSIMNVRVCPNIIVMGDFNADCNSSVVRCICGDNLIDLMSNRKDGTYKYHGQWSSIDHILVSKSFFNDSSRLRTSFDDSGIYSAPFLLEEDKSFGGMKPKRTFLWRKYNKGFSDHLPVYGKIRML